MKRLLASFVFAAALVAAQPLSFDGRQLTSRGVTLSCQVQQEIVGAPYILPSVYLISCIVSTTDLATVAYAVTATTPDRSVTLSFPRTQRQTDTHFLLFLNPQQITSITVVEQKSAASFR